MGTNRMSNHFKTGQDDPNIHGVILYRGTYQNTFSLPLSSLVLILIPSFNAQVDFELFSFLIDFPTTHSFLFHCPLNAHSPAKASQNFVVCTCNVSQIAAFPLV